MSISLPIKKPANWPKAVIEADITHSTGGEGTGWVTHIYVIIYLTGDIKDRYIEKHAQVQHYMNYLEIQDKIQELIKDL